MISDAMKSTRQRRVAYLVAACLVLAARPAWSQYGVTQSLPASAVIMNGGSDGWHSRGGVVGPWWSGSGTGAMPPAADGGFWFGTPSLGFGGSQGSTRGMNTFAPSVTTTSGGAGMMSSGRLIPFVTGVMPVVGSGYPIEPGTTSPYLGTIYQGNPSVIPRRPPTTLVQPIAAPASPAAPTLPSTPQARSRAEELVAATDRMLREARDTGDAARAALQEYRSAMRFARDDADIEIRQAMIYEALGKRRDADRAIDRATRIDARLSRPLRQGAENAGGFLAVAPLGQPLIATRGFVILDEITAMPPQAASTNPVTERPAVIEWLADAWSRRWERHSHVGQDGLFSHP
jgi:hypothetical protein